MGRVKRELGQLHESLDYLNKSLQIFPDPFAFQQRGETKRDLGDLAGALEDLNSAVSLSDNDPKTLHSRAVIKDMIGDLKGAAGDIALSADVERQKQEAVAERAKWTKKKT